MLIVPLLCLAFVWYLFVCFKWKKNVFEDMEKLPGLKWYPIFGTTYVFKGVHRADVLCKLLDIVGTYRPLFRTWNGPIPELHIMKPEHLQIVMRSSAHITKGRFYDNLYAWLGDGLFISEGPKWFAQRKLLTPAFHFKILEGFMDIFVRRTNRLVEDFEKKVDGKPFNIAPDLGCATLDMMLETSIGIPVDQITDDPVRFIQTIHETSEMAIYRFLRPYLRWNFLYYMVPHGRKFIKNLKYLQKFSDKVIALRKEKANNAETEQKAVDGNKKFLAFMDLILEASNNKNVINDKDLESLLQTFIFAGSDTTATSAGWALFLLANNLDIQEKVHEEVVRVLKDKRVPTTLADLNELKYLECVIKEALRLYPALPIITRQLTEDVEIDGYKIPTGVQAILHIGQVHRDPEQFPEPNKFDPDRFLPENIKGRHPFAFIPFSAGPRNCIGQRFAMLEEKTILAAVVKKFKVTTAETPEEKKLFVHLILRPQDGINVQLELR